MALQPAVARAYASVRGALPDADLRTVAVALSLARGHAAPRRRQSGGLFGWVHGDWYLTVGATGMSLPDFEGAKDMMFGVSPIISLGKAGPEARFISRNDNISLSLYRQRRGPRRRRRQDDLRARRRRAENSPASIRCASAARSAASPKSTRPTGCACAARCGKASARMTASSAELSVDAFADVTPTDPRFGRTAAVVCLERTISTPITASTPPKSAASGLSRLLAGRRHEVGRRRRRHRPGRRPNKLTTSVFGEYSRLMGPAADSSLVSERGSKNQFMFGVSATYRFDFQL